MTATTETTLWICESCGFIYDPEIGDPDGGIPPGTKFEDIPRDWFCPVCGAQDIRLPAPGARRGTNRPARSGRGDRGSEIAGNHERERGGAEHAGGT